MKIIPALLAAVLATPASAQSLEALRFAADSALIAALPGAHHPDLQKELEPVLQEPLQPLLLQPSRNRGAVVGKVVMAKLKSANRHVTNRQFGARSLDLGIASNASFSSKYFTFTDAASTTSLAPIGDMNRLRGEGVNARIDAKTVYNFKVIVNIFSPVRGSTLKMTPIQGTAGPSHEMKTGALLDAIKAKSFVFKASGQELLLSYDADVLPDGSGFADTNSFLFSKEDGLSSKAWPLSESKLPLDTPGVVDLEGIKLTLTRTSAGTLIIQE
ncbi:MAG: hypothetical protein Q7J64_05785 [Elusimicrobiota bacterium]|nr:hypothetical protein [Elusimicrobiota bacterium]